MGFAFIQAASIGTAGASATSIAVTVSAVGAGNLLEGVVTFGSGTSSLLTSITDNIGNTYTIKRRVVDSTNGQTAATFYGYNLTGGPTTITANFSSAINYRGISVQEFSGVEVASDPIDGTNEQGQVQASPGTGTDGAKSGSGTQTPSADNYLVCGHSVDSGAVANGSSRFTAGTNFTEPTGAENTSSSTISLDSEYWIQTTATPANASFTVTANVSHITFQLIFKVASVGGGSVGSAAGTSTVAGIGASTANGAGSSAGIGTATAVGAAVDSGIGASAGISTVSAVGVSISTGVGNAAGQAICLGIGASISVSVGNAAGIAACAGVGASGFAGTGLSSAIATVTGVGSYTSGSVGLSAAISIVNGVGASLAVAQGSSAGITTVNGIGATVVGSTGNASATSTVIGLSTSVTGHTVGLDLVFTIKRHLYVTQAISRKIELAINIKRTIDSEDSLIE